MGVVEVIKEKKAEKIINAKDITIEKYLCDSNKIIIPRYQREYSWDYNNINTLVKDFKKDYYIGNIIECNNVEFLEKEIIDGQQRTITIFLILIVLKHLIVNEKIKNQITNLIIDEEGKSKLVLKYRISSSGNDILEFFINNAELPSDIKKRYNEVQMYEAIKKDLKNKSQIELVDLYERVKSSILIEISFYRNEMSAHEMFVNVNTKGKPLDKIEIIKSQLFKYLVEAGTSDEYKEKWHNMLEKIPKKEYDAYCNDTYLFDLFKQEGEKEKYPTNGTVNENCTKLIDSINIDERAKKIFGLMAEEKIESLLPVYSAIKNYDILELKNGYYSNNIQIGNLDNIWKLYKELGFQQSDIMIISLLVNKEHFVNSEINYLTTFVKYLLMYELCRSFMNISPANYSNSFKQAAAHIYNCRDNNKIKSILKEFTQDLVVNYSDTEVNILNGNVQKVKTLKLIIMIAEDIFTPNLTLEHFISQKTAKEEDKELIWKVGNLIPVIKDRYKNKDVTAKLEFYEEDKESDIGIRNFLEYNFTNENYKIKIEERSKKIAKQFIEKMDNCYNTIMEG